MGLELDPRSIQHIQINTKQTYMRYNINMKAKIPSFQLGYFQKLQINKNHKQISHITLIKSKFQK